MPNRTGLKGTLWRNKGQFSAALRQQVSQQDDTSYCKTKLLSSAHVWNCDFRVMSGGIRPPYFRSPHIHLFLEPEPSGLQSVLRCGLCHSDLFSSVVTSWPLHCLCLTVACWNNRTPTPPAMHFQTQATERLAAEQLRIWIDLGWCLHSSEVWSWGCTVQCSSRRQGDSSD